MQWVEAGGALGGLDHVFLAHQHSDPNADLGNLVFLAWSVTLKAPVHPYGPPRIARMIDDFVDLNATTYRDDLIALAKGADVLVRADMCLPAREKMMATIDDAPTLLDHLIQSHTTTEPLGRVAAAAARQP